jgi:excisionase family DNA binding protein
VDLFSNVRLLREAVRGAVEAQKDLDVGPLPEPPEAVPAPAAPAAADLLMRVAKLEARPVTVAEAARVLGVAEKTVRRRIDAGTLASTRTGRRVVVHLDHDPVGELARRARSGRPRRRSAS